MNHQKLLIISATRVASAAFDTSTLLGRSLRRLSYDNRLEARVAVDNRAGLPAIYNRQICEENLEKILLFVHDDVWLDDCFIYERLLDALDVFDVVGVAGNIRRLPGQPAWAFTTEQPFTWDDSKYLSGTVAHGDQPGGELKFYGMPGQNCRLLDGVFLAARCRTLLRAGVRFDERFMFDFYDADFCRSAEAAKLTIGTWPIAITHNSVGKFRAPWHAALQAYRAKWGEGEISEHHLNLDEETRKANSAVGAKFQKAFARHQRGELAEAGALYGELLAQTPDHFDALHFQGVLLHQTGRHVAALESLNRAIALDPTQGAALSNIAVVQHALGRLQDALASCDRALILNPDHAEVHANRANVLKDLKRHEEALASYDRALALKSDYPEALLHRGNALAGLHRYEEALASYDRALALDPAYSEALSDRGGVLIELKQYDEAVASLDRALALKPDNVAALSNRGAALVELKRQGEALASLDRALLLSPDSVSVLFNRGTALRDLKRPAEAAQSYARLLEIDPWYPYAQGYAFHSRLQACDWSGYAETAGRIQDAVAEGRRVDAPFSFFAVSNSASAQLRCAQTWVADKCPAAREPAWTGTRYSHGRIRVAYLSADFSDHPVAYSVAELFETHDREKFEVFGVSFGPDSRSAIRVRLQGAFDRFIDARNMSDRQVAQLLRSLEIDIAIDLNGFTQGNRAAVLAQRGAAVQVSYLGHSGTMGAGYIDYIIGDPRVIPPEDEPHYSEKVVRLPDTYLVNDRNRSICERALTRTEAGLPPAGFVFCSFNNSFKITPDVFDIWMRLLARVEGSVLWLFEDNAAASGNLRRQAESRGIDARRILFARRVPLKDHLARYRLVDLFLDTLPYNAHITASDALWAGAPVLTCMGSTFVGRVAASLLHAVGLPELVTHSLADYEALALRLASAPGLLGDLKARLARNRSTHALFDTDRFRRHLEQAYLRMHERSQQGLPPEGFAVQAIA